HTSSAWLERARDQFDRLYAEGTTQPRVMALAVHPYISGVPHRIEYFEAVYDYMKKHKGVWFTTGEEIYEWYRSQGNRAWRATRVDASRPAKSDEGPTNRRVPGTFSSLPRARRSRSVGPAPPVGSVLGRDLPGKRLRHDLPVPHHESIRAELIAVVRRLGPPDDVGKLPIDVLPHHVERHARLGKLLDELHE